MGSWKRLQRTIRLHAGSRSAAERRAAPNTQRPVHVLGRPNPGMLPSARPPRCRPLGLSLLRQAQLANWCRLSPGTKSWNHHLHIVRLARLPTGAAYDCFNAQGLEQQKRRIADRHSSRRIELGARGVPSRRARDICQALQTVPGRRKCPSNRTFRPDIDLNVVASSLHSCCLS